jgi:exonuclease SbcD
MQSIRLLHTADIHIGMENYGRIDPATGINGRVMDFLRRLSDIGDYAIEQGVDVFIFAGDAYKTRDPNPTFQREFARRIKRIADAGIPVVLLVGNHDLPAVARRATSIDIFGTLDVPKITVGNREEVFRLTCRRGQPLQVATAPYPLRSALVSREEIQGKSLGELDGLLQAAMIDNLQALAAQARQTPDVPAVLVGHFSVNEASHGSEQNIMVGRDAALPRSVLADPTWRYVALGHIHRHQSLNGDRQPPILYAGSIERIDFGEEHEPKGFVVAEIGEGATSWQFVRGYRRQARSFVTVRADVRDAADPTAAVAAAVQTRSDLGEAVVRVIVTLRQEQ